MLERIRFEDWEVVLLACYLRSVCCATLVAVFLVLGQYATAQTTPAASPGAAPSKIKFALQSLPFRVETDETLKTPHAPATMAGGVAVFDYNNDGRPDIFFTNGANIETLKKDDPNTPIICFGTMAKAFTDVTEEAGLTGTGYDMAVAIGDYDNDGYPDLFVGGLHRNTLYHNNGNGTFTDVTAKAGLDKSVKRVWAVVDHRRRWVDVNNDGLLDLFVVNYLQWDIKKEPLWILRGSYRLLQSAII